MPAPTNTPAPAPTSSPVGGGTLSGNYSGTIATTGGSDSYTVTPSSGGSIAVGSCAVSTGDAVALYLYGPSGALLSSGSANSYCNWASASVSAGQTYTVKTVMTGGSGLYRSAWSVNGAPVVWNVGGSIDGSGTSKSYSFPTLGAGAVALSSCGPTGTNYNRALTSSNGAALASAATGSACASLSYTSGGRALYRLVESSVSGSGAWNGTITTQ